MENEQENTGGDYSNPGMYQEEDKEFIIQQIDVNTDLERFTQEVLRGQVEIFDEKTGRNEWLPIAPNGKKPMNELGVRGILVLLKGTVTKLSKLSCKTDDEIRMDMFHFDMSLTEHLYYKLDEWEIDFSDVKAIKESAVRLVWDVAASSRDGFTAINLRSQYQRNENTTGGGKEQQGKSLFGIPLGKR